MLNLIPKPLATGDALFFQKTRHFLRVLCKMSDAFAGRGGVYLSKKSGRRTKKLSGTTRSGRLAYPATGFRKWAAANYLQLIATKPELRDSNHPRIDGKNCHGNAKKRGGYGTVYSTSTKYTQVPLRRTVETKPQRPWQRRPTTNPPRLGRPL